MSSHIFVFDKGPVGTLPMFQRDSTTFRATAFFFRTCHSAMRTLGDRCQNHLSGPASTSHDLLRNLCLSVFSQPLPITAVSDMPCPGSWEKTGGTGSGLALHVSRIHEARTQAEAAARYIPGRQREDAMRPL